MCDIIPIYVNVCEYYYYYIVWHIGSAKLRDSSGNAKIPSLELKFRVFATQHRVVFIRWQNG